MRLQVSINKFSSVAAASQVTFWSSAMTTLSKLGKVRMVITPQLVEAQIRRLSGLMFRMLSFPRELERQFESDTKTDRCRRLWLEGLLALVIFNIVLLLGQVAHPAPDARSLILKLYLVTPLALIANIGMLFTPPAQVREGSIAMITMTVGLTALFLESNRDPISAMIAQFGVATVLVFGNSVMRLRFLYALGASTIISVGEVAFVVVDRVQSSSGKTFGLGLTMATVLFTLIANYSHNREERINFLLNLRGDLVIEQLSQTNQLLAIAADQDPLTGLANRRSFDRRILEVWTQAQSTDCCLSLILVDIDHFKKHNDSFGHLFGDKVLRRIASLLQETLRRQLDYVARIGGEEFVILLPETAEDAALKVAERLRSSIERAGHPAFEAGWRMPNLYPATVSCGVVSGSPFQFAHIQEFLDSADRALYRAKALGRNTVCAASDARLLFGNQTENSVG